MPSVPAPEPTGTSTLAYVPGDAECVSGIFPNSWMDGRKLLGRGLDGELSTVPIEITDLTAWLFPAGETTTGQNFHLGFGGGGGSVYTKIGYASDIRGGKVHHWADRGSSGPARRDVPADGSDPVYAILENRWVAPGLTFRTSESVQMVDDCSDSPAGLVASLEFNGPPKASTDQSLYLEEQSSPSSHRFFFPAPIDWGVENPTGRRGGILLRRVDAAGTPTWTGLTTSVWHTVTGLVSGAVYDVYWFYSLPVQVNGLAPDVLGSYGGFSKQITVDPKPGTPVLYSANSTADGLGANLSWETGNVGQRNLTAAEAEVRQNGVVVSTGNPIAFDPNWQNDQPIGQVPLPRRGETFQVRVRYMTETGVWSDYSAPKDVTTTSPTFDPGTYWDGSFDADKDNVYSWEGTANGSASVRSMYRVNDMFSDGIYLKELSVTDPSSPVKTQGSRVFSLRRDRTAPLVTAGFRARYQPVIESLVARLSFWVKFTPNEVYGDPDTSPIRTRFRVYESGVVAEKITETIDLVPGEWIQVVSEPLELLSGSFNLIAARMYTPSRRLGPGDVLSFDGIMLSTGGAFFDYFDGATPNGGQFTYSWTGEANDSSSLRELTVAADPRKPFLDPDCPPVPVAPRPPVVDPSCGEVDADTWRRYWIEIPQSETFTSRALLPTLRITTGYFAESLVRIRFWPNPDNTPAMLFDESGGFDGELIISYIPANAEMILDGVSRILTGSTNGSEPQILNNLLSGTDGTPATWPVMDCERGWLISVDVLPESPEGNLDVSVDLTARMG